MKKTFIINIRPHNKCRPGRNLEVR